jgi:hypothetical protein
MSQNKGWFKQYRADLMQFSKEPLRNVSLHNIFTYLLANAVWNDHDGLKKGQVRTTTEQIQKWMPYVNSDRIKKLMRHLVDNNYITRITSATNELGFSVYEICNYDMYSGINSVDHVEKIGNSTGTASEQHQIDNELELLNNNYDDLTHRNSTGTASEQHGVLLLLEERIKEINVSSDELRSSLPPIIDNVKLSDGKKERKPRKPKAPKRQSVTKYHHIVARVFEPDPRFVKNTWVDKKAIFFAFMVDNQPIIIPAIVKL